MSDEIQRQYFNLIPPYQSATPGRGVTWLATAVTAAAHDMSAYPDLFGKLVVLYAYGARIWVSSGPAATPAIDMASTAGTFATGTLAAAPIPIADGEALQVRFDRIANRYLHVQASAGTPTLIIFPASQGRLSDGPAAL